MRTEILKLIVAILGPILASQAKDCLCWLPKWVLRKAVANLPIGCRERYNEEWENGIEEIPGVIFKLAYSIGLLRASLGIRKAALAVAKDTKPFSTLLKRLFDISVSGMVLVLYAPLLLVIAIAIKVSSRGPTFYAVDLLGKNGRVFRSLKFRTMTINRGSERAGANVICMKENMAIHFEIPRYPKITSVGRVLREYSLDELPQLFSVLRGDMSIVGPRPRNARHAGKKELTDPQWSDLTPGITGLSQIQCRLVPSSITPTSLDKVYAKNRSFLFDLRIIAKTIAVILSGNRTKSGRDAHRLQDEDD